MPDPIEREQLLPAFFGATDLVADVLAREAVAQRWTEPSALAGMSIGGLAAHIYLGQRQVEVALEQALPEAPRDVGILDFYGANRIDDASELQSGLHRYVRDEGEQRAARYGAAGTLQRFVDLVARLRSRLPEVPLDRPIPVIRVPEGVTSFAEYLTTRMVELVVHSDDLAASLQLPPLDIPELPATVVIRTLVDMARGRHGDIEIIRALTRQERTHPDVLRAL